MRMFANGREIDVPEQHDGTVDVQELRRIAGVSEGRMLAQQKRTGGNHVVPTDGRVAVQPYEHFIEVPRAERGGA